MNKIVFALLIVTVGISLVGSLAYLAPMISDTDRQRASSDIIGQLKRDTSNSRSELAPLILYVHVVSGEGKPLGDVPVVTAPVNSTDDVIFELPGGFGPTVRQCGREVPSGAVVKEDEKAVVGPNGSKISFPKCPVESHKTNNTGWATIHRKNAKYYLVSVRYGNLNVPSRSNVITVCENKAMYVTFNVSSTKFDFKCVG